MAAVSLTPRRKQKFGSYTGAPPSVDQLPYGNEKEIMVQVWKRIGDLEAQLATVANSSSPGGRTGVWDGLYVSSNTRWVDLTNGDPSAPELIFDALGQVIVVLEYI